MESNQNLYRQRRLRTTGFASPAEDFFEKPLDLNDLVVLHPATTLLLPVGDASLSQAGMHPGDLLLIDAALAARPGRTVLVSKEGETTVGRVSRGQISLVGAGGPALVPWESSSPGDLVVRGVVTTILHPLLLRGAPALPEEPRAPVPDLNALLVANPLATFFTYVEGSSMARAAIFPGDILIVDRSVEATHQSLVIAVLDGRLTIKRLLFSQGRRYITTADPRRAPVEVPPSVQMQVWGVVTYGIHSLLGPFPHISRRQSL